MDNFNYFFLLTSIPVTFGIFLAHIRYSKLNYAWLFVCWIISMIIIGVNRILFLPLFDLEYFYCFPFFIITAYFISTYPIDRWIIKNGHQKIWNILAYAGVLFIPLIFGWEEIRSPKQLLNFEYYFIVYSCLFITLYAIYVVISGFKKNKNSFKSYPQKSHSSISFKLTSSQYNDFSFHTIEKQKEDSLKFDQLKKFLFFIKIILFLFCIFLRIEFIVILLCILVPVILFDVFSLKNNFIGIKENFLIIKQKKFPMKIHRKNIKDITLQNFGIMLIFTEENIFSRLKRDSKNAIRKIILEDVYEEKLNIIFQNLKEWHQEFEI